MAGLCRCYPTKLLGTSPHWYRSRSYRARVVRCPPAYHFTLTRLLSTVDAEALGDCCQKAHSGLPHFMQVREPRVVLREFGTEVPEGVAVHVHDSTADLRWDGITKCTFIAGARTE